MEPCFWILGTLILTFCHFGEVDSKPTKESGEVAKIKDNGDARVYLLKYGYLTGLCAQGTCNEGEEKSAIKLFQEFANLKQTGKVDTATLNQMNEPRCSNRDFKMKIRVRRYNHQGSVWKKSPVVLTWQYEAKDETKDLSRDIVVKTLKKAMCLWSSQTNVAFKEETDPNKEADIRIAFAYGRHNDPFPFDGAGGVLAHAFYPMNNQGFAGDLHFDDAETYTVGSTVGRNLLWIATHELGHSLGLAHTSDKEAIMYPWYLGYVPNLAIRQDDRRGIQTLYGGKIGGPTDCKNIDEPTPTTPRPTTTTAEPRPRPSGCPTSVTAIWEMTNGRKGLATEAGDIYTLRKDGTVEGEPRKRSDVFPKLTGDIDAAYTTRLPGNDDEEYTIFFHGKQYSVYKDEAYQSGPHSIHNKNAPLKVQFDADIEKVDAAIRWQRGSRPTYFFFKKSGKFMKVGRSGLKKTVKSWRLPSGNVNAAFSSKKDGTYFLMEHGKIYKFNDRSVRPYTEGYPTEIGDELIICGDAEPIRSSQMRDVEVGESARQEI